MRSTTSEFSYGIAVNMSATVSAVGVAGVAAAAIRALVIAPERCTSTGTPAECSSFHTAASACRLAPLVSCVKAAVVSIGAVVTPAGLAL